MKIIKFDKNSSAWHEWRKSRITGSKAKATENDRYGKHKMGWYQLIADQLALDDEVDGTASNRDWGHEHEEEAIEHFSNVSGLEVVSGDEIGVWARDDNDRIAISPDGGILNDKGIYTAATEAKCLSSALHIMCIIENKVPYKYWEQCLQYFVVNDDLETLYFISFDPRVKSHPLHVIEIGREEVEEEVKNQHEEQESLLAEADEWVLKLAF